MPDIPMIDTGLGFQVSLVDGFYYSLALNALFVGFLILLRFFTWDVTWPWLMAFWKRRPIIIEYDKSKHWRFIIPEINKEFPDVIEVENRPLLRRRNSFGIAPHKIQMALFTSEFAATVSPGEINGAKVFTPSRAWIVDEDGNPDPTQSVNPEFLRIEYPSSTINCAEFVDYQPINVDPSIIERFAKYKELAMAKQMSNAFSSLLNPDFLKVIIPLLVVGGIVFMWLSNNNEAVSCNAHLRELYEAGVCVGKAAATTVNESIRTGGGIR